MSGLSGHMMHPHDNLQLTIEQFIELVGRSLDGSLKMTEKIDGFNIHFFNYDGELRFARSAKDLNEGGFNRADIETRFSDERVREVYRAGYDYINKEFPWEDLPAFELFGITVNADIVKAGRTNIMYYKETKAYPHNMWRWIKQNDKYEPISVNDLAGYPKPVIKFEPMPRFGAMLTIGKIYEDEFEPLGLDGDNTLKDYYKTRFDLIMGIRFPKHHKKCPAVLDKIFERFFGLDKTNLRELRKMTNLDIQPILDERKQIMHAVKGELDRWVLTIGTIILEHVQGINVLSGYKHKACAEIEEDLRRVRDAKAGTIDLKIFERRWEHCGDDHGDGKILPIEGVVVKFEGNLYKWTGPFAPINQLIGGLDNRSDKV